MMMTRMVTALAVVVAVLTARVEASQKPNIIFVVADDLGEYIVAVCTVRTDT